MSDMKASVTETANGFEVTGYEKIEYDFSFIDGVFDTKQADLANCYKPWGRCLAVMDMNIYNVYGEQMQAYFDHYGLDLKIHKTMIGEKAKSIETLLSIVDSMNEFGIIRKEPVLVVGGGLVTDVCGRVLQPVLWPMISSLRGCSPHAERMSLLIISIASLALRTVATRITFAFRLQSLD